MMQLRLDWDECTEGMATNKSKVFNEVSIVVQVCCMVDVTVDIYP